MISAGFWELAGIVVGLKHICGWIQSASFDAQLALNQAVTGEGRCLLQSFKLDRIACLPTLEPGASKIA